MSIASWCFHRAGDFRCPTCTKLQSQGKLHRKARVAWYESYFWRRKDAKAAVAVAKAA
jgi:hypothetical protein